MSAIRDSKTRFDQVSILNKCKPEEKTATAFVFKHPTSLAVITSVSRQAATRVTVDTIQASSAVSTQVFNTFVNAFYTMK